MEYKAIQFEIVQTRDPCCWKWIIFLDATRTRTGIALTRADAMLDALRIPTKSPGHSGMMPPMDSDMMSPRA